MNKYSYTAANSLPLKIIKDKELLDNLSKGRIIPIHAQLNPTNKCYMNCSFCSCKNRDRQLELSLQQITDLIKDLVYLGCKAVTITGGGEPLLYTHIIELIELCIGWNIKIGLVTTAQDLDIIHPDILNQITWIRISCSDESKLIDFHTETYPKVDLAFSYVVTNKFDIDNLIDYILYANQHNFTHIRVVSDLLNLDNILSMDEIKKQVVNRNIDNSLVIYQGRKEYVKGQKNCYISLLKPNIGADGKIYPCCGISYQKFSNIDFPECACMGSIDNIIDIIEQKKWYNGENCDKCYYSDYNKMLEVFFTNELKHIEFV
jgi:MoaA/NifB/PqqE/SkfB family radical SAM enzyme